jgi:hypothetical protein
MSRQVTGDVVVRSRRIRSVREQWLARGPAAAAVTQVFSDLSLLDSAVDWEVMRAQIWKNTAEDPDRMRRRMAEFLVHTRVPIDHLAGIAVRTESMMGQVNEALTAHGIALPVRVRPSWYY